MIRYGLRVAVDGVECVRCERCWDEPFVVRFVKVLVEDGVVQPAVHPVDAVVCEEEEAGECIRNN